jgi:tetratricopeptide (TPR) repeat protein
MSNNNNKPTSQRYDTQVPPYADQLLQAIDSMNKGGLEQARQSLVQITQQYPNAVEAFLQLGILNLIMGRYEIAANRIRMALQLAPNNTVAHQNLGVALHALGQVDDALTHYKKALALDPDSALYANSVADTLMKMDRVAEAAEFYQQAANLAPDSDDGHFKLACALRDTGEMETAKKHFRRAIGLNPSHIKSHYGLALIHEHKAESAEVTAIESLLKTANLTDDEASDLAFALGRVYEKSKQYDKAFEYILRANKHKRATKNYSVDQSKFTFGRIKSLIGSDFIARNEGVGIADKTPILIVGMPRSGTSLVEQILASHPDVHGAGELYDLNLLTRDLTSITKGHYPEGLDKLLPNDFSDLGQAYVDRLKMHSDKPRVTDKLPDNFYFLGLLKVILPNSKVIHCCRDPIDTCLSIFKNSFGGEMAYAYDLQELGEMYLSYRDLMEHWHHAIPGWIYNLDYQQLVTEPEVQTQQLLDYCELSFHEDCLNFHRTDRVVKTVSAAQVRKPMYKDSIQSWKHYESQLTSLIDLLNQPSP